jgi:predicted nucleotidyltransferase
MEKETKSKKDTTEFNIALDFSKKCINDFEDFLKAIVLFGSTITKNKLFEKYSSKNSSDIDILIIIEDTKYNLSDEIIASYRVKTAQIIKEVSERIHITTLRLSKFWELILEGDPLILNILRDGEAIYDSGFFLSFKKLLEKGKIKPSAEAILTYLSRSIYSIKLSEDAIKKTIIDLYWAILDASQAALMYHDEFPPPPEKVYDEMLKLNKKISLLTKKEIEIIPKLYHEVKNITHGLKKKIKMTEIDELINLSKEFVKKIDIHIKEN